MAHQTTITVNGQEVAVTEFDHTAQEIDDAVERVMTGESGSAVLYVTQELTEAQKTQARTNIDAVSAAAFNNALGEVDAALTAMDGVIG